MQVSFSRICFWLALLVLGLFAGSAMNILMYHLPRRLQQNWRLQCQSLLQGIKVIPNRVLSRKYMCLHCLHCHTILPAWMSLPLLRMLLFIKCPHCYRQVGKTYNWVEWGNCLMFLVIAWRFDLHLSTAAVLLLVWGLVLLALIDGVHYLLPDYLTLTLIWLGLLSNACGLFISAEQAIFGAVAGYASLCLIGAAYRFWRGVEGIGQGDYKLLAVFGAWWGMYYLPIIVFMASILGLIATVVAALCGKRHLNEPLPFGPYLVGAGILVLLFGKTHLLALPIIAV